MCETISGEKLGHKTWEELEQALPRIATMLDCKIDDLKVIDGWAFPSRHMMTKHQDKLIKVNGITDTLPLIQVTRLHSQKGTPGFGIFLYACRNKEHLKYVIYSTKDPKGWGEAYVICKKGELFHIWRNCLALEKQAVKQQEPILEEGLLRGVIDSSIEFLLNSKRIEEYGVRIKRGILLDGPPGNGKTMLCRHIQELCTKNNIEWGVVTASMIDKAYQDNEMDSLFNRHEVTFFDDIDVSYLARNAGFGKMACAILTAMDGMSNSTHTIRFFTTNESVKNLDEAFLRPGRIDKRFYFRRPDAGLRLKLIKSWPDDIVNSIDCERLARETKDNSFAELEAVRANLVTNYLFGNNTWDLNKALIDYENNSKSFSIASEYNQLGFSPSNDENIPQSPAPKKTRILN